MKDKKDKILTIEDECYIEDSDTKHINFKIETENYTHILEVEGELQGCENYGILISEDNLDDFIGADLYSIDIVDEEYSKFSARNYYYSFAIFVNFETSKGRFQTVAYNSNIGCDEYLINICTVDKKSGDMNVTYYEEE